MTDKEIIKEFNEWFEELECVELYTIREIENHKKEIFAFFEKAFSQQRQEFKKMVDEGLILIPAIENVNKFEGFIAGCNATRKKLLESLNKKK